jgi:hypothetical protein
MTGYVLATALATRLRHSFVDGYIWLHVCMRVRHVHAHAEESYPAFACSRV